jgi:glycosyltransferase involved in cell wall biosynthesis
MSEDRRQSQPSQYHDHDIVACESAKLSVVIPVYNERETIERVLERVQAVEIEKEIVIVDDGSTDGTREFLLSLTRRCRESRRLMLPLTRSWLRTDNIRVFFQPENRGKGAAVRRGFDNARAPIVLVQDADLELDPRDYFKLLEPIEERRAQVVYGSRFFHGRPSGQHFRHYFANRLLTLLSNTLTGLRLSDVWTCYKVIRREVIQSLELREDRFGFEPEVTAKLARGGWRICEVPVAYFPRSQAQGKKIRFRDGLRGVWNTVRYSPIIFHFHLSSVITYSEPSNSMTNDKSQMEIMGEWQIESPAD